MIFRYYSSVILYKHEKNELSIKLKYFLKNGLKNHFNNKTSNNYSTYRIKNDINDLKNVNLYLLNKKLMNQKSFLFFHYNKKNYSINKDVYMKKWNFFYNEKRSFSGRSGGLKRKKKRKEERLVNNCSAKRLEFFYPKKKRRQRIGIIQNSRKNIVYDNILKRFLVYYYKQGIQVFRSFSCKKKKNFESARNKAIILSKQFQKRYSNEKGDNEKEKNKKPLNVNDSNLIAKYNNDLIKQIKIIPDKNKSGYRGVFYDPSHHAYICVYNEAGIRKFQIFKIQNNDYLEAYNLAVMCRRYKLFKNFQFVAQRNRIRSGRVHLK
ncbi:transcription factor with AP2 domain(s), putative [Plasmodium gallinaceum]|uniref:Transcription factor with AP2 domain(S), putative n=1 Tax=Plasmodium gallinaceum TaxID=5849 RepID=A0A1J1GY79_PLAGA|nr:transcription factor with AP2 domain(s), putative [Plasmodium gallinaceum]CRG97440.1 transcription factor with AP2 domain(s), putative [Plasmodium gallinaceum]